MNTSTLHVINEQNVETIEHSNFMFLEEIYLKALCPLILLSFVFQFP